MTPFLTLPPSGAARAVLFAAALGAVLGGCGSCGSCGSGAEGLAATEPSPHVRCLAADPSREGTRDVGEVTLSYDDRSLILTAAHGEAEPLRFAAFAGPAPFTVDLAPALAAIAEGGAHFVVVLGGFGDDAGAVEVALAALTALEMPVLLVPGGRDDAVVLEDALAELSDEAAARIVDLSPYDRVAVGAGALELLPVAGAPGGRYGRTGSACGFGPEDLDDRAGRLGEAEGHPRYLLSWASPAGGVAADLLGADGGDPDLAEFGEAVGTRGGVFAWPAEAAGRVREADGRRSEVVRRLAGAPSLRPDGTRAPTGASFFTAGADGISSP